MTRVPVTIERVQKLWPPWVAARVSNRTIYVREDVHLTNRLLAHELRHIVQRDELGWGFLFAYVIAHVRAGFSYRRNSMEVQARAAEVDPVYLSWAEDVLAGKTRPAVPR